MPVRTYVDSSVLIAAYQGSHVLSARALSILDDPDRQFLVSDFLRLEVLPQPRFHRRLTEVEFMETYFAAGEEIPASPRLTQEAVNLASRYQLTALDALHAAAALLGAADEFVTLEKPSKPLCRIQELKVTSLYS